MTTSPPSFDIDKYVSKTICINHSKGPPKVGFAGIGEYGLDKKDNAALKIKDSEESSRELFASESSIARGKNGAVKLVKQENDH